MTKTSTVTVCFMNILYIAKFFVFPIFYIVLLIFFILPISIAHAKDFGVIGQTYPIVEQDFLEFIQAKLKALEASGELTKMKQDMQERAKNYADRPHKVLGITRTVTPKTWDFDPSMQLAEDLRTQDGVIFAKKGQSINPLSTITLHEILLFYDADDKEQVKWAQDMELKSKLNNQEQKNQQTQLPNKLILVNGSILSQTKIFNKPIYFDQQGRLTAHFGITHVPAIVKQNGLVLQISEVIP